MKYPLVRDLAAEGIPVAVTCRVLGFSKQAFYKWKASPCSNRDWHDAHLVNAALDIHRDDPAFGYRFIADELAASGHTASENRVQRLCSEHRIWSVFSKKRGLNRKAGPPVHDDLVDREFVIDTLNRVWLTDITEHHTSEGKLYLCAIKDTNGLLRQYFPKGTDLSRWGLDDLLAVQDALNSRPRKVLGWKTPAEALDEQLRSLQQAGVATAG